MIVVPGLNRGTYLLIEASNERFQIRGDGFGPYSMRL